MANKTKTAKLQLKRTNRYWVASFDAMASPCFVFIDSPDESLVKKLATLAFQEAMRIERKFSRYRKDNIVHEINNSQGDPVEVDEETALLLNYAQRCYELSEGLFDITSGVLRKAWRFNQPSSVPEEYVVEGLLERVGWSKVLWNKPCLQLQPGMELDFGGVGKEYAVDRTGLIIGQYVSEGVLINYGGDLLALGPLSNGDPWEVAIEQIEDGEDSTISIARGAIATSGDSRRFIVKDGKRYGHIINPKTGWPVEHAPRSVTMKSDTCLQAGMLSTFAMLQGENAEAFLREQGVEFYVYR